ncbi:MAG: hypothetical protein JXR63_09980 [Spirochaetales bacterium]|nr:hypothetical protein [Spirochaetales bacterium]
MNYTEPGISADLQTLRNRAQIVSAIRFFLEKEGFLEVETPIMSPHLIPEANIEIFSTRYQTTREDKDFYLTPSPEIWMKQIIAQYQIDIFQITKSFRNCEAISTYHNPEFTMLEYYSIGKDFRDSLNLTKNLLTFLAKKLNNRQIRFSEISLAKLFQEKTGMDLPSSADKEYLTKAWKKTQSGQELNPFDLSTYSAHDIFDLIFVTELEPEMRSYDAAFMIDFPAFLPTTAKVSENPQFSQRWELYLEGLETANCYTEKSQISDMSSFFKEEEKRKASVTQRQHRINHGYCQLFESFPESSGVALGVDRLVMFLLGKSNIKEVLAKPFSDFLI